MRSVWRSGLFAAAALGLAPGAWAFSAGDPALGLEFALENCARCHDTPGGRGAGIAPAFREIAGDAETWDAEAIAEALKRPHWGGGRMARGDAANVTAFIAALRADGGAERAGGATE